MNLISIRIITDNVKALVKFYEQVTGITAVQYSEEFAELQSQSATLAIGSTKTLAVFGGDEVAKAAQNQTAIIEFIVKDVDANFSKLGELYRDQIVQEPTLMPWGNKSLLLRDPDGNLVNLFTPVTVEAQKKFDGKRPE